MADKNTRLRAALAQNEDQSFVGKMKSAIKSTQGDGISARTHRGLAANGIVVADDEVQDADELLTRQTMQAVPKDATIALPDGRRITPLQYQKLMQMQLRRGG
jgi:hypothetical protein